MSPVSPLAGASHSSPHADADAALIPPLRDNQFLIDLIAKISQVDRQTVTRRFIAEHLDLGCNVRDALRARGIPPHVWSSALQEFYADTDAFLYETLVWNRCPTKASMRQWMGDQLTRLSAKPAKILTFGDGLGIDAYYLRSLGHEVTYFDVSQPCAAFARALFEQGNLQVEMVADSSSLPEEAYQVVVCLDTLEHVPDPFQLVGHLTRLLRPHGWLIVHAPFFYIHPCVSTHLRSNCRYSGDVSQLYRPHGLRPIHGRLFWNPLVLEKTSATPSARPPLSFYLGGAILRTGSYWSLPLSTVARLLLERRRLAALVADLEAT